MSKETSRKRKSEFKPWVKVLLSCLFLVFAILSVYMIRQGIKPEIIPGSNYYYQTTPNVSYKVYLLDNPFYEEKFMPMGKQYPSSIIDYVDIDFIYELKGNSALKGKYSYSVEGTIIGNYENTSNGKSELWTKKYDIVKDNINDLNNNNNITVVKNVRINYQEYNKVVNDFKSNFRLAIDAYLNVKMKIYVESDINGLQHDLKVYDTMEVNIPLNTSTIKIETKSQPTNKIIEDDGEQKSRTVIAFFGIVLMLFVLLLFVLTFKNIYYSTKTKYIKKLNKLLKTYSEILVEVEELPELDENITLIDVTNFDDMIDLEEELKSPIMYEETIKGEQTVFVIAIDGYAYRFFLESE